MSNKYNKRLKRKITSCECCGLAIPCVLHVHHLKVESKRVSSNEGGCIVLCANCHYILHHGIGWNNEHFNTNKQESINVVRKFLSHYNNGTYGQFIMQFD